MYGTFDFRTGSRKCANHEKDVVEQSVRHVRCLRDFESQCRRLKRIFLVLRLKGLRPLSGNVNFYIGEEGFCLIASVVNSTKVAALNAVTPWHKRQIIMA